MKKTWFFPIVSSLVLTLATACSPGGSVVAAVTVSPNPSTVFVGGTRAFSAIAQDSAGNTVTAALTWSSSNTAVATVNASTGVAPGSASITATTGGVNGTATLNVGNADLTGVWDTSSWDSTATWGP